jgi:hypothetical protein
VSGHVRTRQLLRALEAQGWTFSRTGGGHLRGIHPEASGPLFLAATLGGGRGDRNALAQARRLLAAGQGADLRPAD